MKDLGEQESGFRIFEELRFQRSEKVGILSRTLTCLLGVAVLIGSSHIWILYREIWTGFPFIAGFLIDREGILVVLCLILVSA